MELALITMNKIIEMVAIMMIGVVMLKTGIADRETSKKLSSILLNVISPCLIIMSYQMDFNEELLRGLLITIILSAASFIIAIALAHVSVPKKGNPNAAIEKMVVTYSNCGFIGIPIVNAILGTEGVFYMTAYITVYNIFIWSHGLMLMSGRASSPVATAKNFIQPSTIAIIISLVLFVMNIHLPSVIASPFDMIGDMNTPVAMLISGINLAESDLVRSLKRPRTYLMSCLKLIAVPVFTAILLAVVHTEMTIALTVIIAAACPTGAMVTMFALQYKQDSNYASELFTITTVLSLITIPIVILISGFIL